MPLTRLSLDNFTVFDHAELSFAAGLTVLAGSETATAHGLQLAYALYRAGELACSGQDGGDDDPISVVEGIFCPDDSIDLRGRRAADETRTKLHYTRAAEAGAGDVEVGYGLDDEGDPTASLSFLPTDSDCGFAALLGKDDILAKFPIFVDARDDDELPMRRDEIDLCFALQREAGDDSTTGPTAEIVARIEGHLGGTAALADDGRSLTVKGRGDVTTADRLAPGLGTLLELAVLLRSGTLARGGVLLWDRPAPHLAPAIVPIVAALVEEGIQLIVGCDVAFADGLVAALPDAARRVELHV